MDSNACKTEQDLYDRITETIMRKDLRPGERINELQLSQSSKLARTRVRRVLEQLAIEGVVEFKKNHGAYIRRPSVAEALATFEARIHIESSIFTMACQRILPEEVETLRRHVQSEQDVFNTGSVGINSIAGEFHVLVASAAKNEILAQMARQLIQRVCLIQSLYEGKTTALCLASEHEELTELISQGQSRACVLVLREHLEHILSSLNITDQRFKNSCIYTI